MINVQIGEADLLDLFMNRLEYWTSDDDVLELYKCYLRDLIDGGSFEGTVIEVNIIIDNLYINDTTVMDKLELASDDIDVNDCDRILVRNEEKDLYLVCTY